MDLHNRRRHVRYRNYKSRDITERKFLRLSSLLESWPEGNAQEDRNSLVWKEEEYSPIRVNEAGVGAKRAKL